MVEGVLWRTKTSVWLNPVLPPATAWLLSSDPVSEVPLNNTHSPVFVAKNLLPFHLTTGLTLNLLQAQLLTPQTPSWPCPYPTSLQLSGLNASATTGSAHSLRQAGSSLQVSVQAVSPAINPSPPLPRSTVTSRLTLAAWIIPSLHLHSSGFASDITSKEAALLASRIGSPLTLPSLGPAAPACGVLSGCWPPSAALERSPCVPASAP